MLSLSEDGSPFREKPRRKGRGPRKKVTKRRLQQMRIVSWGGDTGKMESLYGGTLDQRATNLKRGKGTAKRR